LQYTGVIIHRFDNFKKDTIALKLDYGVAKMIFIKPMLNHNIIHARFNLILDLDVYKKSQTKNGRCFTTNAFYPKEKIDMMIRDVINVRHKLLKLLGSDGYKFEMQQKIDFDLKLARPNYFWKSACLLHGCSKFINDWKLDLP